MGATEMGATLVEMPFYLRTAWLVKLPSNASSDAETGEKTESCDTSSMQMILHYRF